AEDVVEPLLLRPVVLAPAHGPHAEDVPVEAEARLGVAHDDRGVVDTEEHAVTGPMPAGVALVGRELEDLERVPVGIPEVEGADAGRVRVPVGKPAAGSGKRFGFRGGGARGTLAPCR